MKQLATENCRGCRSFESVVDAYASAGQRVDVPAFSVVGTNPLPPSTRDRPVIDLLVVDGPKKLLDANGQTVHEYAETKATLRAYPLWTARGWRMDKLNVVTQ